MRVAAVLRLSCDRRCGFIDAGWVHGLFLFQKAWRVWRKDKGRPQAAGLCDRRAEARDQSH